jgi:hypothetical protein
MNTKHLLLILLILCATILLAQSYSALGGSPISPSVSSCPISASGAWALCPVGSGTSYQMYVSYNAGAYVPLGGTGPAGPQGPAGPTGATGPQGPTATLPSTTGTCTGGTITGTGTITANANGGVTMTLTSATLTGCPW